MENTNTLHSRAKIAFGHFQNREADTLYYTPNGHPFNSKKAALDYCKNKGLDADAIQEVTKEEAFGEIVVEDLTGEHAGDSEDENEDLDSDEIEEDEDLENEVPEFHSADSNKQVESDLRLSANSNITNEPTFVPGNDPEEEQNSNLTANDDQQAANSTPEDKGNKGSKSTKTNSNKAKGDKK